jgi:hypothetical protein
MIVLECDKSLKAVRENQVKPLCTQELKAVVEVQGPLDLAERRRKERLVFNLEKALLT